jgi:F-type H+-transporting ATPase subunit b
MPQLSQLALVYQSQWFWLLLVLGAIYFLVGRGIVPKVEATVDARDTQIANDLAEAERLRAEADASEEAWRTRMNEARAEAQAAAASAKAAAQQDADKRVAEADKKLAKKSDEAAKALDEARASALAEIETVAVEAAQDIVARLTGTKVSDKAARAAVTGAMGNA